MVFHMLMSSHQHCRCWQALNSSHAAAHAFTTRPACQGCEVASCIMLMLEVYSRQRVSDH